jgi:hypothetical protein
MTSDMMDPNLCICGEDMALDVEFCSKECERDYHDVLAMHHYERELETQHTVYFNMETGAWTS